MEQKTEVEEQKDVTDPEADPNMTNLPEVTRKDEQEDSAATKPGEESYSYLTTLCPINYDSLKEFEFDISFNSYLDAFLISSCTSTL